ncbi:heat shock factor protein 1-like [Protopterus annectens]|uniref:heat shock factor protein 1-like n=1 Tax=Protopterus annectens TaxID=7888 RepID=UPI001CFBB527|nr:heat shock factor protein 1-like [Protopterus annectens]
MEMSGGVSAGNVPAFLTKLWTLVEDPDTDPLICWSLSGQSFHVFDQGQFAKEVLPKYFKHNNMASFVRQLNMYGFRKVVHIEQGGLVKPEKDDTEFQHPYFVRGKDHLLENIKRKVTNVAGVKNEEVKVRQDNISKILTDVQLMRGKQDTMDSHILTLKHENEALWREVASLRLKHAEQQEIVTKLIHFLVSLVQPNHVIGMKRKIPLMLNDSSSAHPFPKYGRQYSFEHRHDSDDFTPSPPPYTSINVYSTDSPESCGPVISDVTDMTHSSPSISPSRTSLIIHVKEEPPSPTIGPQVEQMSPVNSTAESLLSPGMLTDSILQEHENNGNGASSSAISDHEQSQCEQSCLSIACLDNLMHFAQMSEVTRLFPSPTSSSSSLHCRPQQGNELTDHVDGDDLSLENFQNMLTSQGFTIDSSALLDLFSPSLSITDMGIPDVESGQSTIQELLNSQEQKGPDTENSAANKAGKLSVHYTTHPVFFVDSGLPETGNRDLPVLLEVGGGLYFTEDDSSEDPTIAFFAGVEQPKEKDPGIS